MPEVHQQQPNTAQEQSTLWRQRVQSWAGRGMLAGATFVGGAAYGLLGTETDIDLGPHRATAHVTLAHEVSADLGPLGTVTAKSPARLGSLQVGGVSITVKEIPTDGKPLGSADVAAYESLFSQAGIASTVDTAANQLERKAWESGGVALLGGVALWWLVGPLRRKALAGVLSSRRAGMAATASLTALGLTGSIAQPPVSPSYIQGNPILEAAGLYNIRTEGKILDTTITEYAPEVLKHIKEIDAYYADVRQNLDAAYEAKLLQEQSSSTILGSMSADSPTETVVWTSDIHCNGGMAGIAGWFAQKTKPAFLLDTGDLTMGGTEAEKLCVTYLPQAAGDIPIIAAAGNHDSPDITIKQMKAAGYKVLEGDVIDFNGYRILGDKDVMRSPFGTGIYQWGEESSAQQAARLATKACEQDRPVDILAIHEPVGDLTDLFVGCAKFIASGHLHKVEGPTPYTNTLGDTTITMLTGTTGGAAAGKQTVSSKLGQNATITQLVFNAETKDPLGYRLITFQPDKQVVVGDLIAL